VPHRRSQYSKNELNPQATYRGARRRREGRKTKLPKLESGSLGDGWVDWVFAHALFAEAKALIGTQQTLP
jgi:hypothetical protein